MAQHVRFGHAQGPGQLQRHHMRVFFQGGPHLVRQIRRRGRFVHGSPRKVIVHPL